MPGTFAHNCNQIGKIIFNEVHVNAAGASLVVKTRTPPHPGKKKTHTHTEAGRRWGGVQEAAVPGNLNMGEI